MEINSKPVFPPRAGAAERKKHNQGKAPAYIKGATRPLQPCGQGHAVKPMKRIIQIVRSWHGFLGAFQLGHLHRAQHLVETIHTFSHQCFGKVLWAPNLQLGFCNGKSNQPSIESHASSLVAMPRVTACSDSRWHVLLIWWKLKCL